jgi:hypothetical protein
LTQSIAYLRNELLAGNHLARYWEESDVLRAVIGEVVVLPMQQMRGAIVIAWSTIRIQHVIDPYSNAVTKTIALDDNLTCLLNWLDHTGKIEH